LGFGKPVSGAVDWNTIMPPVLLNDGWVLSPSDELVIWRSSLVSRLYMKICRCEAAALPVHAALFGSQPKMPSASKPTHTSSWFPASTAANVAVAIVGLSGSPGPLVIWRRYGVPIGGHGVFWELVGVSLSAHRFVVSVAQSEKPRLNTKICRPGAFRGPCGGTARSWVDEKANQLPHDRPGVCVWSSALVRRSTGGDSLCSARAVEAARTRRARNSRYTPHRVIFAYVRIASSRQQKTCHEVPRVKTGSCTSTY